MKIKAKAKGLDIEGHMNTVLRKRQEAGRKERAGHRED